MKVKIYKQSGQESGECTLDQSVWGNEYNQFLIHQVVVAQMANSRQGTKSSLTRDEVRGGGKKPWRQKGTGRARQGSIRSPQWTGGGVVFAPKPRDFGKKVNKQAKTVALKSALSQLVAENRLIVLDNLVFKQNKTREMVKVLNAFKTKSALVLLTEGQALVARACGNIQKVTPLPVNQINLYDILSHDKCMLTADAVKLIEKVYGEGQVK
ncbi:MAG: 50S ribosomal protein L4 [Clostridiales bacterium]|jgi:large subunit ribosomal protein L4|nr:50S ribosomal protein L4 [Clostridiales bacterium]